MKKTNREKKWFSFVGLKKNKKDTEEIEILDFDESVKYEPNNNKRKIPKIEIKNKFKFMATCVATFAIFILVLSIATGTNVLTVSVKKVLNGLGIYTEAVKKVEIESPDYNNPGSWHIDKSAEWIESKKARVTFDVSSIKKIESRYNDVILVLDRSGSMAGEKMDRAISDSKELVSYLLSDSNSQNRVAIVTFTDKSTIISEFSNDKDDLLAKLDAISPGDMTNYNAALKDVDAIMNGYTKKPNRAVVTMFLTDGYPNEDTPNQVGTFALLKDKYPYMTINGVQYEMGKNIIYAIKQITDFQWIADRTTLKNVLFEAYVSPFRYEDFIVTDYVHDDYFTIGSVNDIKVTMGTVELTEESGVQKITWNLGKNAYLTGGNAKMYIDLTLKEQYVGEGVYFPTNKKESVTYKLEDDFSKTVNSTKTPVLKHAYEVIYDNNPPDGCTLEKIENETHSIYQNVTKKTDELSCDGYLFKGWEIDEDDAKDIIKVNDDIFKMPEHDVTIRATWARPSIVKSMDGTVNEQTTLYKVLQSEAETGTDVKEYTGAHQDSMDASKSTKKIYYYDGQTAIENKSNVIFAGQCWQMIRTTDTGGVKMIYNGEAEDNKCFTTRGTHVGYDGYTFLSLKDDYWFGTDYIYDSISKTFRISGTTDTKSGWSASGQGINGKYTCGLNSAESTCSTLYLVESDKSGDYISLKPNSQYASFGKLEFSSGYPTGVGYMYGDAYDFNYVMATNSETLTQTQTILSTSPNVCKSAYKYSKIIDYTGSSYSLVNPILGSVSPIQSKNYAGYYTFGSDSTVNGDQPYYIVNYESSMYTYCRHVQLTAEKQLSDFYLMIGDSITDNGDGTYTVNNPISVSPMDWFKNFSNYKNKYTCGDATITTCSNPRHIVTTTNTGYDFLNAGEKIMIGKTRSGLTLTDTLLVRKDELIINSSNYSDYKYTCNTDSATCTDATLRMITEYTKDGYKYEPNRYYGSSVTWDGSNYTLVDPIEIETYTDMANLSTHHYMCESNGLKTCQTVAYVYQAQPKQSYGDTVYEDPVLFYITLENGTTLDKAKKDMFTKNIHDSTIKTGVDAWYKKYILDYDDYIEDTIFCNDRSFRYPAGWDNGSDIDSGLQFGEKYASFVYDYWSGVVDPDYDLSCINKTDRFSVSNPNAKLTYKVGLMTFSEIGLSHATSSSGGYWLASPNGLRARYGQYVYNNYDVYVYVGGLSCSGIGNMCSGSIWDTYAVRPAVSLKPGTGYSDGDGSMEHPYRVD